MDLNRFKRPFSKLQVGPGWDKWRISLLVTVIMMIIALALLGWGLTKVQTLEHDLATLESQYGTLQEDYKELEGKYGKVWTEEQTALLESEQVLIVPYTAISEGKVIWVWRDIDGNIHRWTMPIDSYRSWVDTPKPRKTVALQCDGGIFTMLDYRPYIHSDEFTTVIPGLYQQTSGGREFVQEVFTLVSQLTVYSEDIGEVPRWPIETLTEGRGDCEDLTILFASLLEAAPHPYKLSIVYIDSNNPTEPQYPDHVIVAVGDEDWRIFIECSSDEGWKFYDYIKGWFFEL